MLLAGGFSHRGQTVLKGYQCISRHGRSRVLRLCSNVLLRHRCCNSTYSKRYDYLFCTQFSISFFCKQLFVMTKRETSKKIVIFSNILFPCRRDHIYSRQRFSKWVMCICSETKTDRQINILKCNYNKKVYNNLSNIKIIAKMCISYLTFKSMWKD